MTNEPALMLRNLFFIKNKNKNDRNDRHKDKRKMKKARAQKTKQLTSFFNPFSQRGDLCIILFFVFCFLPHGRGIIFQYYVRSFSQMPYETFQTSLYLYFNFPFQIPLI